MVNASGFFPQPNVTGLQSFLAYDSTVTGGAFGWGVLLLFGFISFFSLGAYPKHQAFIASTFLTFIAAVLEASIGMVPGYAITIAAVLFIGSLVYGYYSEHR